VHNTAAECLSKTGAEIQYWNHAKPTKLLFKNNFYQPGKWA